MARPKNRHVLWLVLAVAGNLLLVPTGIAVKIGTINVDPLVFTSVRYLIVGLILLPVVIANIKYLNLKNLTYVFIASLATLVSGVAYSYSIQQGEVSIVSIVSLITPIAFIAYSLILFREKISRGSLIGILLAVLGASLLFIFPIFNGTGVSSSTPMSAVILSLIDALLYPVIIIFARKADDNKLPTMVTIGLVSLFTALVTAPVAISMHGFAYITSWNVEALIAVLYCGIAAALLSRWLVVESYERLGSVLSSALSYAQYFLAIVFPILIFNERVPIHVAFAGVLILIGVVLTDRYYKQKRKAHGIVRR